MPTRLLILDCDGVLIRSERANLAYYNHLFEVFGLPTVDEGDRGKLGLLHTLSTPQVIEEFFPPTAWEEAAGYAGSLDFGRFAEFLEAEPGWDRVLAEVRRHVPIAVATNRGASAHGVLERVGLLHHLDLVVTICDAPRPKPYPDLLLRVLQHFGFLPGDALYVGDSAIDRSAARAAEVPFLGFRDGVEGAARCPEEVAARLWPVARTCVSDSMPSITLRHPK